MARMPWFPLHVGDWLADSALSSVSPAARGVWIDLLCLAHQCDPRGVFATDGKPWSEERVVSAVRGNPDVTRRAFQELVEASVIRRLTVDDINVTPMSRDCHALQGAYFSKRMFQDEAARLGANKRQQRRRQSKVGNNQNGEQTNKHVTPMSRQMSRDCHGDVTAMSQGETETESEKKKSNKSSGGEKSAMPKPPWEFWPRWSDIEAALTPLLARPEWVGYPAWVGALDTALQDAARAGLTDKTGDAESLVLDALASAKTHGTQFDTPKGLRSWLGQVVARCVDSGCKPGEWRQERSGDPGGSLTQDEIKNAIRAKLRPRGG